MPEIPTSNRQAERRGITMKARCRTMSGMRDEGTLTDLSTHGCCVITRGLFFGVGTRVVIKPDGFEGVTGVVRWINGSRAGVQFDVPLYGPIVDFITQNNPVDRPVMVSRAAR